MIVTWQVPEINGRKQKGKKWEESSAEIGKEHDPYGLGQIRICDTRDISYRFALSSI
jgi:hypothetical protein